MWSETLRSIIIVVIPFSLVFYGASLRKDNTNNAKVIYGKSIQKVAIASAAFLIVGDYLATGSNNMLLFYFGLAASILTVIVFWIVTKNKRKGL